MRTSLLSICALLAVACNVGAHEETVHTVQYNVDNFADEVVKKNHFVMFYAPWCGHCKRFSPTWEELAEMLNTDGSNIRIAKVDCTTDSDVCNENEVTGYPTLKFFKAGESEGTKFRGSRDLPSLTSFINEQISLSVEEAEDNLVKVPEPEGGLIELTEDTFDKHVSSGKHFVKFYAPWCGYCQKLAPIWQMLSNIKEFDQKVTVAKVDCTQHRNVCNQFDIKGYPTLLWLEDGKKLEKYQGQRTLQDLVQYVNMRLDLEGSKTEEGDANEDNASNVITLTGDNFESGIEKGIAFVKFFAPWCGHCKRLAPTWEELGKKFIGHPEVNIVKIDCTLDPNKQLCSDEVEGFPTVLLYKDGKKISEYTGNRSLQDLYEFVQQHAGSSHDEL